MTAHFLIRLYIGSPIIALLTLFLSGVAQAQQTEPVLPNGSLPSSSGTMSGAVIKSRLVPASVNDRSVQSPKRDGFSNEVSDVREDNSSSTASADRDAQARFFVPSSSPEFRQTPLYGLSSMNSFGVSFSNLFRGSGITQIGYSFQNGIYIGLSSMLFNQFGANEAFPVSQAMGTSQSMLNSGFFNTFAGSTGADFGYEAKVGIGSITLVSRFYVGGGLVYLAALGQGASSNLFATAGNLIFHQFNYIPLLGNIIVGIDMRYIGFQNVGTTGMYVSFGRRF